MATDEPLSLMEPLILSEGSRHRGPLTDLALELAQKSAGFRRAVPASLVNSLAHLVRSTNCYYSNLIEGHSVHPIDIERALQGDYSKDAQQHDLQLEAVAHIAVQQWIDEGGLKDRATSVTGIREIHRRFCKLLPEELSSVEDPATHERSAVIPGELRQREVAIGKHIAVSAPAVPRFLDRFEQVYGHLEQTETVLAAAAAHHRLAWIHPFIDVNGRVVRLMSHATLVAVLDTGAVWSIARGLARNVTAYKAHLAACDETRRNDLDGRGNLSEENLAQFTRFFLTTCLEQVSFMETLMQPEHLRTRILLWTEEHISLGELPLKSNVILEAILSRGELARSEVAGAIDGGERQAHRIVSALMDKNVLVCESAHAPLRLAFPAAVAARWMPGLFPER